MRRVLIVVILIVGAAVLGLWRTHGGIRQNLSETVGISSNDAPGDAQDETRKSFQLQRGARLEVLDINGSVEVQTSDTNTTEVYVRRTANSKQALSRREVVIEETPHGLMVRGQTSHKLGFWEHLWGRNPNEEVTIKAPRQIALSLKGINGKVTSGDVDGTVEVKGINGRVQLGQATDLAEIGGINGNVSVGISQLGDRGARFSGVNGNIELRLANSVNADFTAHGMNGNVRSDIPEVAIEKNDHGSSYSARIGNGGAPITVSGINGNVRLTRPDSATANTLQSSDKKPATESNAKQPKTSTETKSGQ
jgi:hypothetical protein